MEEKLLKIKTKLQKLIDLYEASLRRIESQEVEIQEYKNQLTQLSNKLQTIELEKQNVENKLNFYTLAPEKLSTTEIKKKIDQYITEIDDCIKLIEK